MDHIASKSVSKALRISMALFRVLVRIYEVPGNVGLVVDDPTVVPNRRDVESLTLRNSTGPAGVLRTRQVNRKGRVAPLRSSIRPEQPDCPGSNARFRTGRPQVLELGGNDLFIREWSTQLTDGLRESTGSADGIG